MTGYTKLFGSIIASTIWRESKETKIVWITMLAMSNQNGIIEASLPGLADMARVTIAECEDAILKLTSPDQYSRTSEHEGRRIKAVDGGWMLLNHGKYRAKMGLEERREYLRIKQQESRHKRQHGVNKRQQTSTSVINVNDTQKHNQIQNQSTDKDIQPPAVKVSSQHNAFLAGWCENYEKIHRVKYQVIGGRDGKATKELLRMGILRIDLLEIAKKAWVMKGNPFLASRALTIHGFWENFNAIHAASKNGHSNGIVPTEKRHRTPEEQRALDAQRTLNERR